MKARFMRRRNLVTISLCLWFLSAVLLSSSRAQIDFFHSPAENKPSIPETPYREAISDKKATILFFISPECLSCPDEAARLEKELTGRGWKYEIEGIFVGDPPQLGKYLAALQSYPFNFKLGLDMDGRTTRQYGVKTFPSAAIEVDGKRVVITRVSDLWEKLR